MTFSVSIDEESVKEEALFDITGKPIDKKFKGKIKRWESDKNKRFLNKEKKKKKKNLKGYWGNQKRMGNY